MPDEANSPSYQLLALQDHQRKFERALNELQAQGIQLPFATVIVMANDLASKYGADERFAEGMPAIEAGQWVGSYYRLQWYLDHLQNLPANWLLKKFPNEWMMCDPDDTKPEYLYLWQRVFKMNKRKHIATGLRLQYGRDDWFVVYRGQPSSDDPLGISWTTDLTVARKFANGAGLRTQISGVIIKRQVKMSNVLAFLTGRGESEIITNPVALREA